MSENDPKEIVSELREYADRYSDPTDELMRDAADTIEGLKRERDRYLGMLEAAENLSQALGIDTHGAAVDVAVRFLKEKRSAEARLSEAVKVLELFAGYEVDSIEAVGTPVAFYRVNVTNSQPRFSDFSSAKAFLATLGEDT